MVTATFEKPSMNHIPMVAGIDVTVVASWFVDELDGKNAWRAMDQKEQEIWSCAMAKALRRIVVPSGDVVLILADAMTITPTELLSKNRKSGIVIRRHVAMWHLFTHMAYNCVRIARLFHCDHSTVLYGIARVQNALEQGEPATAKLAAMCRAALGGERSEGDGNQEKRH